MSESNAVIRPSRMAVLGFCLLMAGVSLWAQAIFATLTGIVTDPSGASVANVKVTLRNAQSGSERTTTTNDQGYYAFASVAAGTYDVTFEAPGFQLSKVNGVALGGGEKRDVNMSLQIGSTNQTVEVTGTADVITPVDSGEKSNVLTTRQLQNYVQVGSNAAEFIKIVPGFGIQNGVSNSASYTGQTVGINANGDAGSQSPLNNNFSYNGLPGNTLDIVADGAHVSDPGCNCDTPVNPNSDFLQEFRVLTSNFSAENQKGPMVITSVTKSGGTAFHGSGFLYARHYALNSNDAYSNAIGLSRPANKYFYPGGTLGGPVLLPWTNFNRNRNKLFFFTGYEYFFQTLDTGALTATVPTPNMINGNFSPAELAKLGNRTASGNPPGQLIGAAASWPGGIMPANLIDPSMQALMKLYPAPNADPNSTGGYNYVQRQIFDQNNQQWTVRGDYNVSDNTKVFVRYNLQRERQQFPVGLWWRQGDQVPYPTPIIGKNRSDSVTGTITHVFSPTMTNETVFAYTFVGFPNVFNDPSKVDRNVVGYKNPKLFSNVAQIPSFGAPGPNEAALIFNPGGFEAGGVSSGLYANKYMPSVSDTFTKVLGRNTFKAGFFYEWIRNAQPASNNTNGYLQFIPANNTSFTYGSAYADMLAGNMSNYQETNFNRINDIAYHTWEGFLQNSWKVNTRLTLELGVRFTHFTPWADRLGYGYSIFDPSKYAGASCATAPTFCGFLWHARDRSVPVGGFPTRALFWQPRFGLAYDLFGTGRMVLRGGWGRFYYHSGQFTSGLDTSAGSATVTVTPSSIGNRQLLASQLNTLTVQALPPTPSAVDRRNDRQPYTDSYSFTISHKLPWRSLLELSYVGNQSHDLQSSGGYNSNLNLVRPGAMFNVRNPAIANANDYRPFQGYSDLNQATNNLYSNYNALQVAFAHESSKASLQLNYTFGKSLGIIPAGTGQQVLTGLNASRDPFNLRNNYGVQPGNRKHLLNAVYSYNLPSPIRNNVFAKGLLNGWQISGVTQIQSGANLSANSSNGNFNMQLNSAILPGTQNVVNPATTPNGIAIGNQSILGTNAIQLQPIITCDPTANLGPRQFLNGNCFAAPTQVGQNGPTVIPAFYGPAFFNSDLGLFKNFRITEQKSLQFRVQAYNFLNHPLWSFPNQNNLTLQFRQATPGGPIAQTNTRFGYTDFKQGLRIIMLAVKFYF